MRRGIFEHFSGFEYPLIPSIIHARHAASNASRWTTRSICDSRVDAQKKGADAMAIKVIVELQAKPGKRAEVKNLLESVAASLGPGSPGFLGSTRYEVLDNTDMVIEIADWESAEVRAAAMQEAMATGAYAPLVELLAAPFRATVIRELP